MKRLLDTISLFLAGISFFAVVIAVVQANIVAGIIAVISIAGAYFLAQRVRALAIEQPINIPENFRIPFVVYRAKGLFLWLIVGATFFGASAYLIFLDKPAVGILLASLATLLVGVLVVELRKLGTPVLILDDRGITTSSYGLLPWNEIDRIHMAKTEQRGVKRHQLIVCVYEPKKYLARLNVVSRWLQRLEPTSQRDMIIVSLDFLGNKPAFINAVVNHLRAKYFTNIGVGLKTGDLSLDTRSAEIDKIMKSINPDDDLVKIQSSMKRIEGLAQQSSNELRQESEKHRKDIFILIAVFVLVMVIYIGLTLIAS